MKKSTLLLCSIFAFAIGNLNAQDIKLGLKAGVNYSTVNGDVGSLDPALSYHAGALVGIEFTEFFVLQPELLYSVKGADDEFFKLEMTYIDVPVLAKVKFSHFSIHAGPQFSYLLSSDATSGGVTTDYKDNLKDFDLAAAAGIELLTNVGLSFGFRYTASLVSVGEDYEQAVVTSVNNVQTTTTQKVENDIKNGVLQFFAAFQF